MLEAIGVVWVLGLLPDVDANRLDHTLVFVKGDSHALRLFFGTVICQLLHGDFRLLCAEFIHVGFVELVTEVDILPFNLYDRFVEKTTGLFYVLFADEFVAVDLRHCFGQSHQGLQLSHSNAIGLTAACDVLLSQPLVLLPQMHSCFFGEMRLERLRKLNVVLQLVRREIRTSSTVTEGVQVDDVLSDVAVKVRLPLVHDNEEQVKARHQRRWHVYVEPK